MGKKIIFTNMLLITMDSMETRVTSQLAYHNNMLYLPLPDTSEHMAARDAIYEDKLVRSSGKEKEIRRDM